MRRAAILTVLAWLPAAAVGASIGVTTDTEFAYSHGSTLGESVQRAILLTPEFDVSLSPRTRAVVSLRARLDDANSLENGRAPSDNYASVSHPAVLGELGTLELRDAFIEYAFRNGLLRIGKQQIVWGRLDGLKVLDVVNPQDFREFILDEFGDSRIGLWSAYLDLSAGKWRAELAIVPDSTGHAIPAAESWFALSAPRFRFGAEPGDVTPPLTTDRDEPGVSSSAIGIRLSRQLGRFDVGALAYTGLDHEPLGRLAAVAGTTVVEQFYERRQLYGVSVEGGAGALTFRAEVSMQPGRTFNVRDGGVLGTTEADQFTAGVGFDVNGPLETFINVQHVHDRIQSAPDGLVRPQRDRITTFFVRRQFSYETIELTARYYYSHDLGDRMATAALAYNLSDATRIVVAADYFDGNAAGLFGQFADRDRITLALHYTF